MTAVLMGMSDHFLPAWEKYRELLGATEIRRTESPFGMQVYVDMPQAPDGAEYVMPVWETAENGDVTLSYIEWYDEDYMLITGPHSLIKFMAQMDTKNKNSTPEESA